MKYTETKETTNKTQIELTEEEVSEIIKQSLDLKGNIVVHFDVSSAGYFQGVLVTSEYTVIHY